MNAKAEVLALKERLRTMLQAEIDAFRKTTGISPCRVDVRIVDVTNHASELTEYQIISVNVGFDL